MKKWLENLLGISPKSKEVELVDATIKQKEDFLAFAGKLEIIIVSDNHEAKTGIESVLAHHPDADYYFHCGDSNLDPASEMMKRFIAVKGNTDYSYDFEPQVWVDLPSGERVFMAHGDGHGVHQGIERLITWVTPGGFSPIFSDRKTPVTKIIFYGHTHVVHVTMEQEILVINPGSIALPRGESRIRSYARLEITPECYDIQIINAMDHTIVEEFQFPREWPQLHQDQE